MEEKSVDIVVPVYSEGEYLSKFMRQLLKEIRSCPSFDFRVLLVLNRADPSTTNSIARDLRAQYREVDTVTRKSPPRLGRAVLTGVEAGTSDFIVTMTADGSDDPQYIPRLLDKLGKGYDLVHGSRFSDESELSNYPELKKILNRVHYGVLTLLFDLTTRDPSNAFKAYRRRMFTGLPSHQFVAKGHEIFTEIALFAEIFEYAVAEVPVAWTRRKQGESKFYLTEGAIGFATVLVRTLGIKICRQFNCLN